MQQQFMQAKSWEERYRLLILAGKNLPSPNAEEFNHMQSITGCEVKVWFRWIKNTEQVPATFHFQSYSEARIVNGLLWILLQEINGKTATELKTFNLTEYFTRLGIAQRLSSTRLNGLKQIEKIINSLPI